MSKRYYWLKLNENFFEKEEIKVIENMQNGKDYIIFYMKLLLKSVGTSGKLLFRDVIPYTPEMLSSITGTSVDTVRVAIDMLTKLGLMDKWDDGTLFMNETQNMIGSETTAAIRKRKQREKEELEGDDIKLLPEVKKEGCDNVTDESQNSHIEIEIDKEIDIDKDIDKELEKENKTKSNIAWSKILQAWNQLEAPIKPIRNITDKRKDAIKARINGLKINETDILKAIDNISKSDFCKGENDRNWIIDFDWLFKDDNRFCKVLEDKYVNKEQKAHIPSNAVKTKFHNFEQRTSNYTPEQLSEMVKRKRK